MVIHVQRSIQRKASEESTAAELRAMCFKYYVSVHVIAESTRMHRDICTAEIELSVTGFIHPSPQFASGHPEWEVYAGPYSTRDIYRWGLAPGEHEDSVHQAYINERVAALEALKNACEGCGAPSGVMHGRVCPAGGIVKVAAEHGWEPATCDDLSRLCGLDEIESGLICEISSNGFPHEPSSKVRVDDQPREWWWRRIPQVGDCWLAGDQQHCAGERMYVTKVTERSVQFDGGARGISRDGIHEGMRYVHPPWPITPEKQAAFYAASAKTVHENEIALARQEVEKLKEAVLEREGDEKRHVPLGAIYRQGAFEGRVLGYGRNGVDLESLRGRPGGELRPMVEVSPLDHLALRKTYEESPVRTVSWDWIDSAELVTRPGQVWEFYEDSVWTKFFIGPESGLDVWMGDDPEIWRLLYDEGAPAQEREGWRSSTSLDPTIPSVDTQHEDYV